MVSWWPHGRPQAARRGRGGAAGRRAHRAVARHPRPSRAGLRGDPRRRAGRAVPHRAGLQGGGRGGRHPDRVPGEPRDRPGAHARDPVRVRRPAGRRPRLRPQRHRGGGRRRGRGAHGRARRPARRPRGGDRHARGGARRRQGLPGGGGALPGRRRGDDDPRLRPDPAPPGPARGGPGHVRVGGPGLARLGGPVGGPQRARRVRRDLQRGGHAAAADAAGLSHPRRRRRGGDRGQHHPGAGGGRLQRAGAEPRGDVGPPSPRGGVRGGGRPRHRHPAHRDPASGRLRAHAAQPGSARRVRGQPGREPGSPKGPRRPTAWPPPTSAT